MLVGKTTGKLTGTSGVDVKTDMATGYGKKKKRSGTPKNEKNTRVRGQTGRL